MPASNTSIALTVSNLRFTYKGEPEIIFPDFNCEQHLLIFGDSGTGKTTLLHLISGLLRIQKGDITVKGKSLSGLSQSELDAFRGGHIGIVFQQSRFIKSLNSIDNLLAAQYFALGRTDRNDAERLMRELGIIDKSLKNTSELSGGERQRLSIARALVAKPALLLTDEPTSSLDGGNAERVYNLLMHEAEKNSASLIVVSHDARLLSKFENRVGL